MKHTKQSFFFTCSTMLLCVALLLVSLTGCAKAPAYEEVDERFRQLVEASYEINEIFFGDGLPTYERVYDPWEDMKVHVISEENSENKQYVYYCYMQDAALGKLLAYRTGYTKPVVYLQMLTDADSTREAVYTDEQGTYYYEVAYTPSEPEWYYVKSDPAGYDYIRTDCDYSSIADVKELAEKTYSSGYLSAVYGSMFDGVYSAEDEYVEGLEPRYYEYTNESGQTFFMKSNTYESFRMPKNIFDFSTAKVVKPSNASKITIEIEFYPENNPSARDSMHITLVQENGQWMLDSTTY